LAHGPEEKFGRAGRMAGLAKVFIAMTPILADGRRPVGRAWPAGQRPVFAAARKRVSLRQGELFLHARSWQSRQAGCRASLTAEGLRAITIR
jgi:hypothetical protein